MAANRFTSLCFAAALVILGSSALSAQSAPTPSAPQVSEAVANELGKLREFTESKSYAPALALIDRLLGTVGAESYDRTLLSQIKTQIYLTEGNYAAAISPLETAVTLGERLGYLPATTINESLFLLAQLYQQQGSELKEPTRQRAAIDKSIDYLRRWQSRVTKPTPESQLFAASLLYQKATLDSARVDSDVLAEARRAADEALVLQIKPPASIYILILATLQQREDHQGSAEILELLLEKNPTNASYWQQLASTYLALAASTKNEQEISRYNLRALLTIERAQARGLLTSPKENFNLIALYLSIRQFGPAIALLEKGLVDGSVENTRRNWELLANAYQQTQREDAAITALEKAVQKLPADGQLEFTLAQLLYSRTRVTDAREHLERAIKKGNLDKPGQTRLFLAYTAFELHAHEDAARWAKDAGAFDDVKKEDLSRLTKAIDEALRARQDEVSKS
ncbi:MAG: hypothetical protein ABW223_10510 [Rariglobus sp.]